MKFWFVPPFDSTNFTEAPPSLVCFVRKPNPSRWLRQMLAPGLRPRLSTALIVTNYLFNVMTTFLVLAPDFRASCSSHTQKHHCVFCQQQKVSKVEVLSSQCVYLALRMCVCFWVFAFFGICSLPETKEPKRLFFFFLPLSTCCRADLLWGNFTVSDQNHPKTQIIQLLLLLENIYCERKQFLTRYNREYDFFFLFVYSCCVCETHFISGFSTLSIPLPLLLSEGGFVVNVPQREVMPAGLNIWDRAPC